jgi:hypothetical protein
MEVIRNRAGVVLTLALHWHRHWHQHQHQLGRVTQPQPLDADVSPRRRGDTPRHGTIDFDWTRVHVVTIDSAVSYERSVPAVQLCTTMYCTCTCEQVYQHQCSYQNSYARTRTWQGKPG